MRIPLIENFHERKPNIYIYIYKTRNSFIIIIKLVEGFYWHLEFILKFSLK